MEILNKQVKDNYKPCNKIVVNFPQYVVKSYNGYLTGKDITYTSDEDIEDLQDILNYNDVSHEDSKLLKNALIYGRAFELCYVDEDGKQRFKMLESEGCIPVYYNDIEGELACVIRYYVIDPLAEKTEYMVEVYALNGTRYFKADDSLNAVSLLEEKPNFYNQVPVVVLDLNDEDKSIFDDIIGLNDAYNKLLSSETDDWEAFCDAYLALSGMDADEETIKTMRENRVLLIPEGGKAEYLTKSVSDTQIENMLDNIEAKIHKVAACPDFTDQSFGTSSGTALRLKLLGFENAAGEIEKNMTKALQKRIELLCSILSLSIGEEVWRDIQIVFKRNLPEDMTEIMNEINALRGLVSDKTLLSQVPFVQDIDTEMELVAVQKKETAELYSFNNGEQLLGE